MNINQVGLYNQNSEKLNKSSNKPSQAGSILQGSHIMVGQSSIQNALASSQNTYGKSQGTGEQAFVVQDEKKKNVTECFEDIKNRMTSEDAKEVEDEGMSLEKYNMERLDRTLTRIKKQKQLKEASIESSVDKRTQQAEDMERAAIHAALNGVGSSQVAEALENANLPVTEENICKIAQALNMAQSVTELSQEGMAYLVANELEPTIFNFYQADHIGKSMTASNADNNVGAYEAVNVAYDISDSSASKQTQASQADWIKLKDQVAGVVEAAGFEATDEVMENCQWLFEQDLPITEGTIKNLLEIQNIKQDFDPDKLAKEIVKQYETGVEPSQADLRYMKSDNFTLDLESFLQDVERQLVDNNLEITDITLHRQLEEIRLKMTTEASQKLEEMGIQIDMEHISDIIAGLKEIENSYYRELFKEAGVDATDEQVELMKQTAQKTETLATMPDTLLGKTFATRAEQTVDTLVEAGQEMKNQMEKAGEAYETLGTEVRKDLGDSIKKAFQNISDILKDLGMEPTEANIRAVKILGYNNIAITEQSVNEMKHYDNQVQTLIDGLKPAVTMEIIQSGMNPLDTPIEEVNQRIEIIQEEIGPSEDEKYSEFLWKLDKNNSLSKEERKAYIGMYRMLTQIEKSDGAAIGSVIKSGKDLTLDNLLTAVKTSKSGGVDVSINDSFGSLENVEQKGETIQEQIKYYRRLSSKIINKVEPEQLADGDISLERLSGMVKQNEDRKHSAFVKEKLEQFQQYVENPEECITFLEVYGQDVTMETMMAAEQVLNNRSWNDVFKQIEKEDQKTFEREAKELVEQMDSDSFDEVFASFTDKVQDMVQNEKESDTNSYVDVSLLKLVGSSLQLTGSLSRQENYHIPMVIGDRVGNVNVTVQHKDAMGGKVEISYESERLGRVQAQLTVKDGEIKGFILTDNQPGLEMIKSEKDAMTNGFEALGFQVKQVDYSVFANKMPSKPAGMDGQETSTKQLLQAAKVFIGILSAVERREG